MAGDGKGVRFWHVRYQGGQDRYLAILDAEEDLARYLANYVSGAPNASAAFYTGRQWRPDGFMGVLMLGFDAISDCEEVSKGEYATAVGLSDDYLPGVAR